MSRTLAVSILSLAGWLLVGSPASGLNINRNFLPFNSAPGGSALLGGGNLQDLFNAAADFWESAIRDDVTINLYYGWEDLSGNGFAGQNIGAFVNLDNAATDWFMDPTPLFDEEWTFFDETFLDLGGSDGPIQVGAVFTGSVGTGGRLDMYSILLHEIGHAIGFRVDPIFNAEVADGFIDVAAPLPFAGAAIPNVDPVGNSADHLLIETTVMYPSFGDERRLLTEADIVALAQVQGYSLVNLDPSRLPEPALGIWVLAALAWAESGRRKRRAAMCRSS